ncbi:magnesium/cobalt transporter CorA [Bacillus sp. BRMEA1]|uniref:magnesium/cobalt transporter CorA n=1 Tax=Neobacillus endophyticus TaxID=2738405 RepID=UPI001562F12D|nr:magnesium/cobalt transporter CorA [Neobacillus endophyticus]NRD79564.1 magnesium/cobalt transporter CorA [Neobacillus endophyticus]
MLVFNPTLKKTTAEKIRKPTDQEVAWIRLRNPEQTEVKHVLSDLLNCHPLVVEDCIKLNQRPKMDIYKDHIFISFFAIDQEHTPVEIALVIGPNYVVSIYKQDIPVLDQLYEQFKQIEGKMEYPAKILYYIMDHCVDEYMLVIDHLEDKIEEWEEAIHKNPYSSIAHDVFKLKRSTHVLRKIFVDERTVLGAISHQKFPYTIEEADVYFVDLFDHISRVIDSIDMFRDSLTGLLDMQISMKGDRMNEIMKILTIWSTIFLPLSFIVGLYGMNIKGIPEYNWNFGYLYVWILLIVVTLVMVVYFKKKKWI